MDPFLKNLINTQKDKAAAKKALADQLASFDTFDAAADYADKTVRLDAAKAVGSWVNRDTDGYDDGESLLDSLRGIISAKIDLENEDELTDEEASELDDLLDAVADYLITNGVTEDDADALLSDDDEAAAEAATRVHDMLSESMDSCEDSAESILKFVNTPNLDGLTLDGVSWAKMHRGRSTINSKHGKKNIVQHKMKWRRATAAQRVALKKNSRRAHTATAKILNKRSNTRTRKMGGRRVV